MYHIIILLSLKKPYIQTVDKFALSGNDAFALAIRASKSDKSDKEETKKSGTLRPAVS